MALTDRSATGSTRTFQTSVVPTIHSARLQAVAAVTPEGKDVASSSQWSARRTASATASFCLCVGVGSGDWATTLRARSVAKSQLIGAVVGLHQRLDLAEERAQVGGAAAAPEQLLERRALEGVLAAGVVAVGVLARVGAHGATVRV